MKILSALFLLALVLAGCSKDPDVVEMSSGLKYADDSLGTGATVNRGDFVTIHFAAWIIKDDDSDLYSDWRKDSTKIKSSIRDPKAFDQPVKFKLNSGWFVKGGDEGIVGMKVGGKRTIIIPANLAYGSQGLEDLIPPNSNIKIYVEIVDAKKPVEAKMWSVDSSNTITTASGLKFIPVNEGTGEKPKPGDIVAVSYSGFLTDGKKFDSSVERDQPYVFTLGRGMVIPAWDEGIAMLKKGGKARLIVPANLGYGEQGMGPIPPNSTLIFDVELVDIK